MCLYEGGWLFFTARDTELESRGDSTSEDNGRVWEEIREGREKRERGREGERNGGVGEGMEGTMESASIHITQNLEAVLATNNTWAMLQYSYPSPWGVKVPGN